MPEIKPDLSDQSRCISVHWSLPVQCVLPSSHRENWHEAWHPESRNRIRYRRSFGVFRTEELSNGGWNALEIQPPGEICGEPHSTHPGVFCQEPRTHNEYSWTHHAVVNGCRYTWNTIKRDPTPDQVAKDLSRVRGIAAATEADVQRLNTAIDEVLKERDELHDRLDQFAYTVAPQSVIGEHSSGNDPWANALEMLTPAAGVEELKTDRDRARDAAVALEQEMARVRELHAKFVCGCGVDHGIGCKECRSGEYPCATIRALDGGEDR